MSQRVAKVESLIQQVVATALIRVMERDAAKVTLTRVDAAPDLRNATVWIGLLGTAVEQDKLWDRLESGKHELQSELGQHMATKFVPHLHFKRDTGGEYAAEIDRLLRNI
jgi:ribosome-binding factor A